MTDVAIIGAGASGLLSAILVKRQNPKLNIQLFERLDRVGKKLSTTGNGRCNISNLDLSLTHFHTPDSEFCKTVLQNFTLDDTREVFASLGIIFKEGQNGKLFPYSLQASSVVDALRFEVERLGISLILNQQINKITKTGNTFTLLGDSTFTARAVLIATGGMAGGKIATDSGYLLLKSLGHKISDLSPAIVQLKCESEHLRALKGNKVDAKVTLKRNNKTIISDFGELLFCDYGLSGPPILNISGKAQKGDTVFLDILPDLSEEEIIPLLKNRQTSAQGLTLSNYFCGLIRSRIGQTIIKNCGLDINAPTSHAKGLEAKLAKAIKNMPFVVTGKCGFANAQVTKGGANVGEFYASTLMSKKAEGLFCTGEVLDVDGDCGGYNLQWAWASANTAANGILKYLG